ncbi:Synoviolin [Operophtera brumata]|uniref:Synoviolin n=1 Tax=Operophtera brumata TaxID=104452 RepID=A0A0L7LSG0_OPEBR|nr:Synoviolin [Operophtera brumata]
MPPPREYLPHHTFHSAWLQRQQTCRLNVLRAPSPRNMTRETRKIYNMLDASVLLMQQYSTVVGNLPLNTTTVSTQTEFM